MLEWGDSIITKYHLRRFIEMGVCIEEIWDNQIVKWAHIRILHEVMTFLSEEILGNYRLKWGNASIRWVHL